MGVNVGGKKPSALLAAYLARSSLFDNVRNQGFGLREWSKSSGESDSHESEAPDSGKLSGAPIINGHVAVAE